MSNVRIDFYNQSEKQAFLSKNKAFLQCALIFILKFVIYYFINQINQMYKNIINNSKFTEILRRFMAELKDYRKKEIPMLLLGNILVLLYFCKSFDLNFFSDNGLDGIKLIVSILDSAVLSSILYVFTIILDGIITSNFKEKLVYLCFGKLPGKTIFTEIKTNNKDIRFSYSDLNELHPEIYENIPQDKKKRSLYENHVWYKLYSKNKKEDMVFLSNKEYLMFRDMYCINILVLLLYLVLSVILKIVSFDTRYIVFLVVFTVLFNISTRNKAKRLAYNVIASELSQNRS